MTTKPIWKSKTFWFNALSLVAYLLAWPEINKFLSPVIVGSILAIVNIVLRLITDQGVTLT